MISAFRICKTRHLATALSGEGARLSGGRWNSPGLPVVYTSSSLSLATLEVLVHLEDPELLANLFSWIPLEIPDDLVEWIDPASLPPEWLNDEPGPASRTAGDGWLKSRRSAALAVPSVVTPGEWNILLNPAHPDFPKLLPGPAKPFRPDPRLIR
jgi:RES domain-containing protein